MLGFVAIAAFLGLTGYAVVAEARGNRRGLLGGGPRDLPLARRLATKWGELWGVPNSIVLPIMKIESDFRPGLSNRSERAELRGGAWGLMQVTGATGRDIIDKLANSIKPEVQRTLKLWTGRPADLLQPELNVMLGTWYLAQLWREFKTLPLVAAAYHQGPGKVRELQAAGKDVPTNVGPNGQIYVARAIEAGKVYA